MDLNIPGSCDKCGAFYDPQNTVAGEAPEVPEGQERPVVVPAGTVVVDPRAPAEAGDHEVGCPNCEARYRVTVTEKRGGKLVVTHRVLIEPAA